MSTVTVTVTLPEALALYRAAGWQRPFPLAPGQKDKGIPIGITGANGRTPEPEVFKRWAESWPVDSNVGVVAQDGVLGLDVDQYGDKRGYDDLLHLQRELGELPRAPRSTSRGKENPSGIRWFKVPKGRRWRDKPGPSIEVISWHHRLGVVWPSIHPNGGRYEWHDTAELPSPAHLPDLPAAWVEFLTAPDEVAADHPPAEPQYAEHADWHPHVVELIARYERGDRTDLHTLARTICLALCRAELDGEPGATSALAHLRELFIPDAVKHADQHGGNVRNHNKAVNEWGRLVKGGREKARTTEDPRVTRQREAEEMSQRLVVKAPPDEAQAGGHRANGAGEDVDTTGALPDGYRMTDTGNAARFLKLADGRVRYVPAWGRWLVYRQGRWVIDDNDVLVTGRAKGVARRLFRAVVPEVSDKADRAKAFSWAVRSESSGTIAAMVRLARDEVVVDHEQLDTDPHLLNVRNGTIDLRTGELRPHDPADLITLQCPVNYDPDARSELWEACLERWQPDAAMRDYLQRRSGAAATGVATATLDVDYGDGANGKSVFHGALQHVLGPHAVVPHKSLLIAQRHEQHPTEIAVLFRKRMAVAAETSAGVALDDESIKGLTGGDRLKGRRMQENPWEFQPSHTLVMLTNHRPTVNGRDLGIWRRIRLVPWEVTIPEVEQDTSLSAKLKAEAAGVLAWLVEGARRFLDEGLTPPDHVSAATATYRSDEDVVGRFADEVLVFGAGFAYSSNIREELTSWCEEQGVAEPRMNEVAAMLRQRGARDGGRRTIGSRKATIWNNVAVRVLPGQA